VGKSRAVVKPALACAAVGGTLAAMRARLRLCTWNLGRLHFGQRLNRWLRLDSRAADAALPHIARVLAGARPDVVALQELRDGEQAERLRALLGESWSAAVPATERGDRPVALLARRPLSPEFVTVDTAVGRATQIALLRGADGQRWTIASVHLDAFSDRARAAQSRELLDWVAARGEPALVLAGDLNLDLAHPAARRTLDAATFRALRRALDDLGATAGATALGGRRLDYVLGRRGVSARVEVLRGRRVPIGDHDPVVALLEIAPADESALTQQRASHSIGAAMDQRRADRRYDRELAIEFTHDGRQHAGRSRNVGLGGLFVATEVVLPLGALVAVRFTVPTQREPIEVTAEVRWTTVKGDLGGPGAGLRFAGLRARDVWALNKFFERSE
jgi:uncharacterized protein (TIGR02266 family)